MMLLKKRTPIAGTCNAQALAVFTHMNATAWGNDMPTNNADPRAMRATRERPACDERSDDELVAAAKVDRAAFAMLYRHYVDPVYRYCHRRLGSRESAVDATSVVFAKALDDLPRYRNGSFRSWLFAIAHNTIVNDLRETGKRSNHPILAAVDLVDPASGPEEIAIDAEDRSTIQRLLAQLPESDRCLLELRLAGLTGAEIARALGRSQGAVRVAQFRAIARLRAMLDLERSDDDA